MFTFEEADNNMVEKLYQSLDKEVLGEERNCPLPDCNQKHHWGSARFCPKLKKTTTRG